jgi:DNA-binding IclR family transcriptional regulator
MSDTLDTIVDAVTILRHFMQELHPVEMVTVADLCAVFPETNRTKMRRIVRTWEKVGFLRADESGTRFKLGDDLLHLPFQYIRKLHQEHERIKSEINTFHTTEQDTLS